MSRVARRSRSVLLGYLVLLAFISGGFPLVAGEAASLIVVTSLVDPGTEGCVPAPGECTLREAIAAAHNGATITFDPALFVPGPGIITLTAGELVLAHEVTIAGPGRSLLKISGNRRSRVVRITATAVARIENVTIGQGHADTGGGIYNGGTLTLKRSSVRGNTVGTNGGGLWNAGTLRLEDSSVRGNTAGINGGGLWNEGTLTVDRSTVSDNKAGRGGVGGGLANVSGGTLRLHHSTVSGNTAGFGGGGLANYQATLWLHKSTVRGNSARDIGVGGGLANFSEGTVRLHHSTVSGNTASSDGGGLWNEGYEIVEDGVFIRSRLMLVQSTVSGNTAGGDGLWNESVDLVEDGVFIRGRLMLVQSTVSHNTARQGGGVWNSGRLTLRATLVAGNFGSSPDCHEGEFGTSILLSLSHNLTGVGTGCPSNPSRGDVTVDPTTVFTAVLGPLQDNGGLTFTHALLPGSPARDAGDPTTCGGTDQRGVLRPQGAGCDIGAFELEVP